MERYVFKHHLKKWFRYIKKYMEHMVEEIGSRKVLEISSVKAILYRYLIAVQSLEKIPDKCFKIKYFCVVGNKIKTSIKRSLGTVMGKEKVAIFELWSKYD